MESVLLGHLLVDRLLNCSIKIKLLTISAMIYHAQFPTYAVINKHDFWHLNYSCKKLDELDNSHSIELYSIKNKNKKAK
jgi:hypothetical protein